MNIELSLSHKEKEYLTPGLKQALSRPGEIRYAETSSISLGRQSKAGVRVSIFISTEPVYMNNKLPARGEILFITALRRNEKMASLLSDLSGSNESSSGREIKSYALTKRTFSIILALFRLRTLEPEEPERVQVYRNNGRSAWLCHWNISVLVHFFAVSFKKNLDNQPPSI